MRKDKRNFFALFFKSDEDWKVLIESIDDVAKWIIKNDIIYSGVKDKIFEGCSLLVILFNLLTLDHVFSKETKLKVFPCFNAEKGFYADITQCCKNE